MWLNKLLVCCVFCGVQGLSTFTNIFGDADINLVKEDVKQCARANDSISSCFSEKAATALEETMDWDIPISDGISLTRNKEKVNYRQARSMKGLEKFKAMLENFFDTHVITIDLSESHSPKNFRQARRGGGSGGGGLGSGGGGGQNGGGFMNIDEKEIRKEAKYLKYAFMVLLGIFGLTGPLVMKVLGVMAAKALLASKAALIIVGSVALKKIFQNDHHEPPSVKVHTIPSYEHDEDHDRIGAGYVSYSGSFYPYNAYSGYYGSAGSYAKETSRLS